MGDDRRFLVVGMQRSGTTLVHQIIAGHPDVFTHSREAAPRLFTEAGDSHFNTDRSLFPSDVPRGTQALDPDELVRLYFDAAVAHAGECLPDTVRGLKVATGLQHETKAMVEAIIEHFSDLAVIVVKRDDPLAACASYHFASHTGRFQAFEGEDVTAQPMTISRDYLVRYVHNWHAINAALHGLLALPRSMSVVYERDIAGGRLTDGGALFDFLGVDRRPVTWVSLRKSLPPPEDIVANHAECEKVAAEAVALLDCGADLAEVYNACGPPPLSVAAHLARHTLRHPGAIRLRSFWAPLGWSLGLR
ncbi:MAG: sulfotransferase [bacterium]|nr:sulfotransferase [bacterium]